MKYAEYTSGMLDLIIVSDEDDNAISQICFKNSQYIEEKHSQKTKIAIKNIYNTHGKFIHIEYGQPDVIIECINQLSQYFQGERKEFDIPLSLNGTNFQKTVWAELEKIPYGETRSYGEIARLINNPKAFRAVGMANNKNPIQIIIPCHRVIGSDGKMTGYAAGLDIKQKLLKLENYFPL